MDDQIFQFDWTIQGFTRIRAKSKEDAQRKFDNASLSGVLASNKLVTSYDFNLTGVFIYGGSHE